MIDDAGFGASSAFGGPCRTPMVFSADETCDIGFEAASPVTEECGPTDNGFSGRVHWVAIDLGDDAADAGHYLSDAERLQLALGRQ